MRWASVLLAAAIILSDSRSLTSSFPAGGVPELGSETFTRTDSLEDMGGHGLSRPSKKAPSWQDLQIRANLHTSGARPPHPHPPSDQPAPPIKKTHTLADYMHFPRARGRHNTLHTKRLSDGTDTVGECIMASRETGGFHQEDALGKISLLRNLRGVKKPTPPADDNKGPRLPGQRTLSQTFFSTSLFSAQHVRRHLHDEVTYRQHTFPKAARYATKDWLHNLWTWPRSMVLHRIRSPVILTTIWTFVLALLQMGAIHMGFDMDKVYKVFSKTPHNVVGSAMSLLLVFRTNAAYTRFWEGRGIWEAAVNKARDLTRMIVSYREVIGGATCRRLADLICAFPVALRQHVEGFTGPEQEADLAALLDECDLEVILCSVNRPICITNRMSLVVHSIPYQSDQWTSRERLTMMGIVNEFSKCVGACERIVQTPIPLHYARHTSRFLAVFTLTLPFFLVQEMGMMAVPAAACVVWCLFGVQEIGLMIENPFATTLEGNWGLPLGIMCRSIRHDVWECLDSVGLSLDQSKSLAPYMRNITNAEPAPEEFKRSLSFGALHVAFDSETQVETMTAQTPPEKKPLTICEKFLACAGFNMHDDPEFKYAA